MKNSHQSSRLPPGAQSDTAAAAPTDVSGQAECELAIEIWPRFCTNWSGSAAQLQAEGLIPRDFVWPRRREAKRWESALFDCWLVRRRPPGRKGPMKQWVDGDYWRLRRDLISQCQDGGATVRIYEKTEALRLELERLTPCGQAMMNRWRESLRDERFRAVLRLIELKPTARTRRAAQQRSSTSHGESHE